MNLKQELRREQQRGARERRGKEKEDERNAAKQEKANREFWEKEFQKDVLRKLPYQLKKLARKGDHVWGITRPAGFGEDIYRKGLKSFAAQHDLTFEESDSYYPPQRGDPESGEGASEGGTVYTFTLVW